MNKNTDDLSDDKVMAVLQAEQKKLNETKEFAEKDGRTDAVEEADKRIAVIATFLPSQLGRTEIEKIISDYSASDNAANVGSIMKHLKENYSGQYDGKLASGSSAPSACRLRLPTRA